MPKIVGIDLGTTNSVVAVIEGNAPTVIPLSDGGRLCPSVVGFSRSGERLVGQLAKRQAITNPDRTVSSIKRKMGSSHGIQVDNRSFSPQEISAMILRRLKIDAEAYLGEPVDRAVVTVPAYFSDAQRQATKDAGTIAGLDVIRILNEPTAAALAYGLDLREQERVLVWDLGGGTFDVSVLDIGDGLFEVIATNGDPELGGDDWDSRLIDLLLEMFEREHSARVPRDPSTMQRLKEAAEKAKIELSGKAKTSVSLPFLVVQTEGPLHLEVDVSRSQFENATRDLLERIVPPTRRALADARLEPRDLNRILLVGGSTLMPAVRRLAANLFGKEPASDIDPELAIALGAAVQGGVLNTDVEDVLLLDVTPLSLGIETVGGQIARIIERNTTIPTQGKRTFTTGRNGQTTVDIRVFQGEHDLAVYNKLLANFQLTGLPRLARGEPQIEVTFDIDVNGIVHVSATDQATGRSQNIQVNQASGLSAYEIDRLASELAQD
jgi:molecular chaperone DnaK